MSNWSRRAGFHFGSRERAVFDEVCREHRVPVRLVEELLELEVSEQRHKNGPAAEFLRNYAHRKGKDIGALKGAGDEPDHAYRLQRLELSNFGPLVDTELVFSWQPDRPLCLIEGNNGYGKSKIIEALRFVLYGRTLRDDPVALLHRSAEKPRARLEVVLHLQTSAGESARLRRSIEFAMLLGEWKVEREAFVARVGDRALQDDEAQEWVDSRLPKHVMECFVFDAENSPLVALAAGGDGAGVAEQLERVLGVTLLRKVFRRANTAASAWRNELDRAANEQSVRQVRATLEEVDATIEKVEKDIQDETGQITRLGEDKSRGIVALNKLLTHFDPAADEARAQHLAHGEHLRGREEELLQALMESVGTTLPVQLLHEHIEFALERTRAARRNEEAGAYDRGVEYAVRSIAQLAAEGAVPWGEDPIPPAESIHRKLAQALGLSDTGEQKGEYVIPDSVAAQLQAAMVEAQRVPVPAQQVDELLKIREDLAREGGLTRETRTGEATPDLRERHAHLLAEQGELEKQLTRRELHLDGLRSRRDDLTRQRTERVKDLQRTKRDEKTRNHLQSEWEFAGRAAKCVRALAENLRAQRVDDLECGATEMFKRTTNKPDLYARVVFDRETLRYHVCDHEGRPAPVDRSTGERAVLSLAVVHGLRQASARSLPLVIEAPLKPLDPVHAEKVINHAFKSTFGQTILLLKPEEIPPAHREVMASRVGQRFVLERPDPGREVSVVRELVE